MLFQISLFKKCMLYALPSLFLPPSLYLSLSLSLPLSISLFLSLSPSLSLSLSLSLSYTPDPKLDIVSQTKLQSSQQSRSQLQTCRYKEMSLSTSKNGNNNKQNLYT